LRKPRAADKPDLLDELRREYNNFIPNEPMRQQLLKFPKLQRGVLVLVWLGVALLLIFGGGVAAISVWPSLGTRGAEVLRGLIGDEAVAQLETAVFDVQDALQRLAYQANGDKADAPWNVTPAAPVTPPPTPTSEAIAAGTPAPTQPPAWSLPPLSPLGSLAGEGEWSDYLTAASGQVVARRTFLQPDPQRLYAVTAIVAFDLASVRLHYALGSSEPVSSAPVKIERTGKIPPEDFKPGILMAAFNGGFQARHGHFGVMVNGVTLIPPRDDFGTVALYDDGGVRLGQWGSEITSTSHLVAWRQNGPLIIHAGQINPHTADNAPRDWGYTVNGVTATWRSALGISADERTLYYGAGPSLTLSALAQALADAGAANAIQLDINEGWVHFDAFPFPADGSTLQPTPLLHVMKYSDPRRYVDGFTRDFFYLTAIHG